jgi:hypothetical protein
MKRWIQLRVQGLKHEYERLYNDMLELHQRMDEQISSPSPFWPGVRQIGGDIMTTALKIEAIEKEIAFLDGILQKEEVTE